MSMLPRELPPLAGVRFERDVPLGPRTTYKVGGPADLVATVEDVGGLQALLAWLDAAAIPRLVLGNGSNLLVSDAGFRGCVVILGEGFRTIERRNIDGTPHIVAGAGVSITRLLRFARGEHLGGLERLGGVPGTVGGAVRMNAGTRWGETADILASATIVTALEIRDLKASELGLAYRHSDLPTGAVVAFATFLGTPADDETLQAYDSVLAYRKATQPLQYPSCGSVFANPPDDAAGRLIEAAELKGARIGGACIAEQHANWILNLGDATAADVMALIRLAQTRVAERFGVTLRPEVQFVGDFDVFSSTGGAR
jgi:UDP-N-acetylmuramate dehydrogenase